MTVSSWIGWLYCTYFWPLYKVILHIITGKSELERICNSTQFSPTMVMQFENALRRSKQLKVLCSKLYPNQTRQYTPITLSVDDIVREINTIKRISIPNHRINENMKKCVESILSYQRLIEETFNLTKPYDSTDKIHENLLGELWNLMKPDIRRSGRFTEEWKELGFQGIDPATDFRGGGILGLMNLVVFAKHFPKLSKAIFSDTIKPNWYPYAVSGLNISFGLVNLIREYKLSYYFYNKGCRVENIHLLFAASFKRFNDEWRIANPPNQMSFSPIYNTFINKLISDVQSSPSNIHIDDNVNFNQ